MTRLQSLPLPRRRTRPKLRGRLSYEQFLKWDGENQHVEWVDGEVVPMPPISGPHSDESTFLIRVVSEYVEQHDLGVVRSDPFQMKTGPDLPGRAPDLLFVTHRSKRRLHNLFLEGPADAVIEIISPGSVTVDRVEKFNEYEQGGVREYWLIDPARQSAEFYRRGRGGQFALVSIGEDGVFHSSVIKGMWLRVEWLWRRPPLAEIRRELGLR